MVCKKQGLLRRSLCARHCDFRGFVLRDLLVYRFGEAVGRYCIVVSLSRLTGSKEYSGSSDGPVIIILIWLAVWPIIDGTASIVLSEWMSFSDAGDQVLSTHQSMSHWL